MTKARHIQGLNSRHLEYITKYNPYHLRHFADDKLKAKKFLEARDIRVPKLIASFRDLNQLSLERVRQLPADIVVKPNNGSRGLGIVVLTEKTKEGWKKISGGEFTHQQMLIHLRNTIQGAYSMSGYADIALIEKRIITNEHLASICYKGLPDIRIIVFNLVPVIAMLRIPTAESGGKANMDAGGIAAGIDMSKGELTYLAQYTKIVHELPGFGNVQGFKIPFWDEILRISSQCQFATKLGYLGVDIAVDKNGPLLLEINARPGPKIQIANLVPLRRRLKRIEGLKVKTVNHGIEISKALFGRKVDKDIKSLSGKTVIGNKEYIQLYYHEGPKKFLAKINPNISENYIASDLFKDIKKNHPSLTEESETLKLRYQMLDKKSQTIFKPIKMDDKEFKVILGRRELHHFLIDPFKYKVSEKPEQPQKMEKTRETHRKKLKSATIVKQWKDIDMRLVRIEKSMLKNYSLMPLNFHEEQETFVREKGEYNPQFIYKSNQETYEYLKQEIKKLSISDQTPQGKLMLRKQDELLTKLDMLNSIGNDTERFTELSKAIFARPDEELFAEARGVMEDYMKNRDHFPNSKTMTAEEFKVRLQKYLAKHNLQHWNIQMRESGVRIAVGKSKKRTIYLSSDGVFAESDVKGLLAHEISTHVMRTENGILQPYELLLYGTPGYLETEEGLAIYNQYVFTDKKNPKFYTPAITYVKTAEILDMSFQEATQLQSVQTLFRRKKKSDEILKGIFKKIYRVKRGVSDTSEKGGYAKDLLYFSGYHKVKRYLKAGGNYSDLYRGKIGIDDLPLINKMEELHAPKFLPHFYSKDTYDLL